jgi:outer membrane protein assembly factor BamA
VNLSRRLQYAIQGYTTTQFFYGQMAGVFYDPAFSGFIDRDLAQATRTVRGGSAFAIYPFNRYRRIEASVGLLNYDEQFNDPALEEYSNAYQEALYGTTLFRNGTSMPLGVLGGVRGVAFVNVGGAYFEGSDFKFFETKTESYRPILSYQNPETGNPEVQYGPPIEIDGLRLRDARGSYGVGLETFALGFPIHFDWSWKTLFNKDWEDALFFAQGGSEAFRKPKFTVWIGYDF